MIINSDIEVLILAGGYGSRLDNLTKAIPKPLVKIGHDPIIIHLLKIYLLQGFNKFYIATGYKREQFLKYFLKGKKKNIKVLQKKKIVDIDYFLDGKKCKIKLINTFNKSMTGGRVKEAAKYIKNNLFFLTYGDGLANVNLKKLLLFHKKKKKLVTITAVNPPPRFGEIVIKRNNVVNFSEKKSIKDIWINGGFFVINKKFISFIKNKKTILEKEPLEKMSKLKQLSAYKHFKFWQCMDTKRDRDKLISFIKNKKFPWLKI